MAQGREEDDEAEADLVQASVPEQPVLFLGAPRVKRMPRYTEKQITLALKRSRGEVTGAAVMLGCSHTSIDKRLSASTPEGRRLRELRESLQLRCVGVASNIIRRAVDSTCWECGGRKTVPVRPLMLGDPTEEPCEVCLGTGWHEGRKEEIDPSERRQWAYRYLQLFGKKQGWGEAGETFKVPREWLDYLEENDLLDEAISQILAGVPIADVYKGTMSSIRGLKVVSPPRQLERGGAEVGA
jgi:hypothetical protein